MAIHESKLKKGVLLLGGTITGTGAAATVTGGDDYACQITNVRLVPNIDEEGDALEVLCGDAVSPTSKLTWTVEGTLIQDWDNPAAVNAVKYVTQHALQKVAFSWQPNETADPDFAFGTVEIQPVEIGGDVNTRLTSDFTWPVQGDVYGDFFVLDAGTLMATGTAAEGGNGGTNGGTQATGATAGTPGTFTPSGAEVPADLAALKATNPPVTASPATPWSSGDSVSLGTGEAHWNGSNWVAGKA